MSIYVGVAWNNKKMDVGPQWRYERSPDWILTWAGDMEKRRGYERVFVSCNLSDIRKLAESSETPEGISTRLKKLLAYFEKNLSSENEGIAG